MKRNKFKLSHEKRLTARQGYLIPTMLIETMPGGTYRFKSQNFTRLAPMIAPPMQRMDVRTYNFFVPERIIWDDAEEFRTRGRNQDSTITVPRVVIKEAARDYFVEGNLSDYFGIPPTDKKLNADGSYTAWGAISGNHYVSALPFRAYQKIILEYFRNQELEDEWPINTGSVDSDISVDSTEFANLLALRIRNHDKDYFTSGKLSANLNAEVNGYVVVEPTQDGVTSIYQDETQIVKFNNTAAAGDLYAQSGKLSNSTESEYYKVNNLNDPLGVSIAEIQRVSAMRRWMLKLIAGGYRLKDYLKTVWNVNIKDERLQLPEFIGGATQPIRISEVLNTSDTANAVQGEMSGHGVSSGESGYLSYYAPEHGYIIQLTCIVPKAAYFQGIPATFKRFDHLDYANPLLADLGPQELPSSEIYYNYTETEAQNSVNFAYKNRYDDYKTIPDSLHGKFRSDFHYWTMARAFSARPGLNATFARIEISDEIFAVQNEDQYFMQIYHEISALLPLPYYANLKID